MEAIDKLLCEILMFNPKNIFCLWETNKESKIKINHKPNLI